MCVCVSCKAGSDSCKLPLKAPKEDKEKEAGQLEGIFILMEQQKTEPGALLVENMFFTSLPIGFGKGSVKHCGSDVSLRSVVATCLN